MAVTTRRPVLAVGGMPYAYVDGQFYFDPEGTHPTIMAYLASLGMSLEQMKRGIWGWVLNRGTLDNPEYVYDVLSDFMPDASREEMGDFERKMDAFFPDARLEDWQQPQRITQTGWTLAPRSAIINKVADLNSINDFIESDEAAKVAIQALSQAGGTVHVVGGAVRDAVLGKNPKDVDLMVNGLDDDQITTALKPLGRLDFTGKAFGVYRFKTGSDEVEIALPRTEYSTGPGHQDFAVQTDPNLAPEEDLKRRDFTVNAMGYNPITGELLDPYGGVEDANSKNLKLVNNQAFYDDPLRIVRALVANARYGLQPDQQMIDAMQDQAQAIRNLPGERIQMEMDKLLSAANPVSAMEIAEKTGLLDYLAPELSAAVGFDQQNPHHDLNVWDHTMQVLRKMSTLTTDPDLRLAALFHDSGKPDSFWRDPSVPAGNGGGHFYKKKLDDGSFIGEDHEDVGAQLADAFMSRLRYPNARRERVVKLVQNHMFQYPNTERAARKFLNSVGGDTQMAHDLLLLRTSDASGKTTGEMSDYDINAIDKTNNLLSEVLEKQQAFTVKDLDINGHDLMALGFKGKQIGDMLHKLLELVIEEPSLNTKEQLLQVVRDGI